MSDYFFYDLNKKMADLANKQQLAETAQATPVKPAPNKLMEAAADYSAKKAAAGKDIGKPGKNFSKIAAGAAKKYGSAEAGKRVAGAVLNKLRHTEESIDQAQLKPWKATMKESDVDESALQAAFGKKKYGDQGMKALQKAGRDHASAKTMSNIRNKYDKYDESMTDEGNAFSGAVVKAKRDGVQSGEKITVGGKTYPVREDNDMKEYLARYSPDTLERIKNASDDQLYSMAQGFGGDQHSRVDRELDRLYKARRDLSGPEGAGARRVKGVQDRFDKVMRRKSEKSDNRTMDEAYVRHLDIRGDRGGDEADAEEYSNEYQLYNPRISDKNRNSELTDKGFDRAQDVGDRLIDLKRRNDKKSAYGKTMGGRIKSALGLDEVDATPQHVDEPVSKPVRKASAMRPPFKPTQITDPQQAAGNKAISNYAATQAKSPTFAPGDMDGATAPPAKGKDGRYPIVTSGPHKGKRWSPTTPGPTNPSMKEGGVPMSPKQKKFAALAKPFDKITFADKIVGAKKEVDEMLGDVAASAMKKAVRGRNRDMEEGFMDDEPTSRRSSSGGRIDTSEPGVTRHRAVKGNYSGAGHDAGADDNDEPSGQIGRRRVGAGMGKKIGAKINRGTSKLMTKEGDMPEDMIEPQDSGEYDQEGDMAKDTIKTVVRHAQALEKILGDDDNLPEWVQSKLAKIENMMTAVDDYMQNQQDDDMPMEEERTNKRDNRAEKAGRKVAKDIEYDEKKKDGIHGRRRGSEDSKAERAGKKVTKDIEYDEKKDKKKKEVDETTSSGSVATSAAAPKSGGGHNYGKGIYDSLNRQLENMISEGMNINMSMNNDEHGGPRKSLTVTATDDDAVMLAGLLKMAGMGSGDDHMHDMTDNDSQMLAIQTMGDEESCSSCGSSPCGCDDEMMDEAYGDTDATENKPDYPTDEEGTDNAMMYSGGLNGPKSTGQTTIPVIAGQDDRMGYNGDHELRRMMEIAGIR